MARVPFLNREDLAPEHQPVWDDIAGSRGSVAQNFQALLNGPEAAGKLAALGGYVRFENSLDAKTKRLAALVTAREADGDYVWTVQVPGAGADGVSDETISSIQQRKPPKGLNTEDEAIVGFVQELLRNHRVSDTTYNAVQQRLGVAGVVDLLVLTGYYWTLSHALSGLEVEPLGGASSL